MKILKITTTTILSLMMVFTMMPLTDLGAVHATEAAATADGGTVESNSESAAKAAFGISNVTTGLNGSTLTITLNSDIDLDAPVRFVKGNTGDKVVLNLNGYTITGKAGTTGDELSEALGGNAIEIAADAFDVEITGPGSVVGGKGGKLNRPDYSGYRVGVHGGSAVFFCERVDNVHGVTENWGDIIDEGYHPDRLEQGLMITEGAELVGGAGADVNIDDWKYNLSKGDNDLFSVTAGAGGNAIGQIFTDSYTGNVLEELSYARIVVENGSVKGGSGGNVDTGDQLLTTTDIQKIAEIQQFMQGKSSNYDFNSNVMDNIKFKPANGGNGIEFFAGRKYIEVGSKGSVAGGTGGKFSCSEKASMVKKISTNCGDGGKGIYVCGDTGLTNTKPSLTASSWPEKSNTSDDVGIYVSGTVTGGASPSTTLLSDSTGRGGEGIDNDFEKANLCEPYTVKSGHRPTFDTDRGIVLVAEGGKVVGGASGAPDETNISGGTGADAMNGGATGGPTSNTKMSAAYFVINGEVIGGYGTHEGGSGFHMKAEKEDTSSGNSVYFCGVVYGNGEIRGGDSGEWANLGVSYSADSNRVITEQLNNGSRVVCGNGVTLKSESHEEATTIGPELDISDGKPAKLMTTSGTFSVTPSMTPFATGTAPDENTKLSCTVTTPDGYSGKVYIMWSADYEATTPRTIRIIEGADGAYNNFGLLSNSDYPYGWKQESYGYTYRINVATRDHIAERVLINDNTDVHIYCHVLLEDGRFIDNDDIWFSKERRSDKGWGGSSGGGDEGQQETDQQAADRVRDMLDQLPGLGSITLQHAEAIVEIREAYENLTDSQKRLLEVYSFQEDLELREAKIDELKQPAVAATETINGILTQIDLEHLDTENPEKVEEARVLLQQAIDAYEALSDDLKRFVDEQSIDELLNTIGSFNNITDDSQNVDPPVRPEPPTPTVKTIVANDVTVADATYTGGALKPAVRVKVDGVELKSGTDYTIVYSNNINAGKGKVTVTGKGLFKGTVTKSFSIASKKITPAVTLSKTALTWNNKVQTPAVTVKTGALVLKKNTDYTVTYAKGRKNVGRYGVKVTLKGNYSGTKTVYFKINPKGTYISKLVRANKGFTVKWKRQASKMSSSVITGYQIQYSLNKKFKSGNKTVTVKGYKNVSKKIGKLKKNKYYYVKIRTYKKLSGVTYYSPWSKVVRVKTK